MLTCCRLEIWYPFCVKYIGLVRGLESHIGNTYLLQGLVIADQIGWPLVVKVEGKGYFS